MNSNEKFVINKNVHPALGYVVLIIYYFFLIGCLTFVIASIKYGSGIMFLYSFLVSVVSFVIYCLLMVTLAPKINYEIRINNSLLQIKFSGKKFDVTLDGIRLPTIEKMYKNNEVPNIIWKYIESRNLVNVMQYTFEVDGKPVAFCTNDLIKDKIVVICEGLPIAINDCVIRENVNKIFGANTPVTINDWKLYCRSGVLAGKAWKLNRKVVLGTNSSVCNITLSTEANGVSKIHCEIGIKDNKVYIKDLGSANGTYIGDIKLDSLNSMELSEGTYLTIGDNEVFELVA